MQIQDVLDATKKGKLQTVSEDATLTEVVDLLAEKNIGALLVTGQGAQIIGIITERDIVRQFSKRIDPDKATAGDVMTSELVTVGPHYDLHVAMDLMTKAHIRHLPVRTKTKIYGIITVRDILEAIRSADGQQFSDFLMEFKDS